MYKCTLFDIMPLKIKVYQWKCVFVVISYLVGVLELFILIKNIIVICSCIIIIYYD